VCVSCFIARLPEHGESNTNADIAHVLADWVDGMQDSTRKHNTVALFLDSKLSKLESRILQATDPNRVRTAVAVGILDELILRARTLAPSLVAVRFDILKSIYHTKTLVVSSGVLMSGQHGRRV